MNPIAKALADERRAIAWRLTQVGANRQQVAQILDISSARVSQYFIEWGIRERGLSGSLEERRKLVMQLTREDWPTVAIAFKVGISPGLVHADRALMRKREGASP
jgi:transposase